MKELLTNDIKIALALALFYSVYRLVLGNDTFFVRNRYYFLTAIVVSFVSPWLRFETKVYTIVSDVSNIPVNAAIPLNQAKETSLWPVVLEVALWVYLSGVLFYLMRFVWAYKKVIGLIINSEKKKFQDLILVITRLSVTPFSLFKWLVIPSHQVNHPGFENIVQHESIHCRQYHSVDLFLAELMVAFQWFNPFAWWLKKSMVENHEFIVDQAILENGMDSRKYQYLLLNFTTGAYQPAGVNYFNTNLLKKRIRMMNKTRSPKWHGLKNSMILISVAVVVAFTATFETKVIAQSPATKPLVVVDGKKTDKPVGSINPENIQQINVIKDKQMAVGKYGDEAANGVVEIILKDTLASAQSLNRTEIKVEGYGTPERPSGITPEKEITVNGYVKTNREPLVILDGKKINLSEINNYKPNTVTVLKNEEAVKQYGAEGKNGVIIMWTKKVNPDQVIIRDSKTLREPIYVVNGQKISNEEGTRIKPEDISSIAVLKGDQAINKYGASASDGVVEIKLKEQSGVDNQYTLLIAPNPGSDIVNITLNGVQSAEKLDVKVYDRYGKLVFQDKKSGPTFTLTVAGMIAGSYIVNVSDGTNVYKGIMVVSQ